PAGRRSPAHGRGGRTTMTWIRWKDGRRAERLLRLGSERDAEASPRPGFETRLRARIASDGAVAADPAGAAWTEGLHGPGRPALALATTLAIVCGGLYVQGTSQPGEADLASLVEIDSVFDSALGGDPGVLLEDPAPTIQEGP